MTSHTVKGGQNLSTVAVDISMSLDGYITGPSPNLEQGLGRGGEAIHGWVMASDPAPEETALVDRGFRATGAVVMGRRTFDFVDGPHGWKEERGYGYDQDRSQSPPNFVVTHRPPEAPRHRTGFTFVTDGVASALARASEAAGDKEVVIMGGADISCQALLMGAVDELRIHLSPVLMGAGTPLFALVSDRVMLTQQDVLVTPCATHLTYRVD